MSRTYCKGCDAAIRQVAERWSDDTGAWTCEGMGGGEHVPDTQPLGPGALHSALMNAYGELELINEFREFEDTEVQAEMNRILRLVEEMNLPAENLGTMTTRGGRG